MKTSFSAALLIFACSALSAQPLDIPASFDTTIDFWNGVVNSNHSAAKQMWAANSGSAPNASEEIYQRFFERFGPVVRFDLSGVTTEMVNDPNFSATLDVMFHGFAADRNVFEGNGAVTPPEYAHHAGDGKTDLVVHALTTGGANSLNRWLANSTSGSLLNWDGTVPTSFALATADGPGNFGPAHYEAQPRATTTLIYGWGTVEGATEPNSYGELTWNITSLVRDWVNGVLPNHGLMITTNPETSYGEQVNMLTSESDDRPDSGISQPGDATPMLRLRLEEVIPVTAPGSVVATAKAGELSMAFQSQAGLLYQLQRSSTMAEGSWTNVGNPFEGTGGTMEVSSDLPSNQGGLFYRIQVSGK